MKILHLVSCRGWSSDAYWAARACVELARRDHRAILGCREGTDARVVTRARDAGVSDVRVFSFRGGVRVYSDAADVRSLLSLLPAVDVVHAHRGKEHWLAAVANRLTSTPRPLVRTRHIVQAVRPHAGNRWLYGRATSLVTTVTEAMRRQYLAASLIGADRIVTVSGGADAARYTPGPADAGVRRRLAHDPTLPLVGMVGGLRVMKGHAVVIEAMRRLAAAGVKVNLAIVGQGTGEPMVREAIRRAALGDTVTLAGFAPDAPAVMRALDVGVYVPLESDGMSRVVFEYLATGTPLVASRVGVVPEVLADGEHASLVPAGDAGLLATALARLLGDADLRASYARAGRALIEDRYSGARVAETLERLYARLAAGASTRSVTA